MKIKRLTIQEIKDNYEWRHGFNCGNSLMGAIFSTLGAIFASLIICLLIWVNLNPIIGIIISVVFCYGAIREQWKGLLQIQRKWFTKYNTGTTDKPRVLFRSELWMPKVNGTPMGCSWGIDIDGKKYLKK